MSAWRQIKHGIRFLVNRNAADRDVDEEAQHYLDEMATELEAQGLAPNEARRRARLEMGSPIAMREQVHEGNWETALAGVLTDCRHAARRLWRRPGFYGSGDDDAGARDRRHDDDV